MPARAGRPAATTNVWARASAARRNDATTAVADRAAGRPGRLAGGLHAGRDSTHAGCAAAAAGIGRGAATAIDGPAAAVALGSTQARTDLSRRLGLTHDVLTMIGIANLRAATATAGERAAAAVRHRTAVGADTLTGLRLTNRRTALARHAATTTRLRSRAAAAIEASRAAIADGAASRAARSQGLRDTSHGAVPADIRRSAATTRVGTGAHDRAIGNLVTATIRQITTIALRLAHQCRFASHWLTAGTPAFAGLLHAAHLTRRATEATIEGATATVTDRAAQPGRVRIIRAGQGGAR